ncbi:MAG: oxidoreductase [Sulfitobacter sp.]
MFVLNIGVKALATVAIVLCAAAAHATNLPAAEGEVVLIVSGDLALTNDGDAAVFDMAMLKAIGTNEFETTTIWTDGPQTFKGTTLMTLMQALGVENGTIRATAINDYSVEIPVTDAVKNGALIAFERNGDKISVRETVRYGSFTPII